MEFFATAFSVIKALKIFEETGLEKTFLNVDFLEQPILYRFILYMKCFVAAYGMTTLPNSLTFAMLITNVLKSAIIAIGIGRIALTIFWFLYMTASLYLFNDDVGLWLVNAHALWIVCCLSTYEFFVDVYLVMLFFVLVFRMYERETDKAFTLVTYLYCLDWFTTPTLAGDKNYAQNPFLSVYLPVFLMLAIRPSNPMKGENFICIAVGLIVWQSYKLLSIVLAEGVPDNAFFMDVLLG